mmetsp:Transcript_24876/g.73106  ORF Transcript_24876/g.73106 Transcript_24876/m.73106 type:complete len:459 (+) Transcript_24876:43-1419(+)
MPPPSTTHRKGVPIADGFAMEHQLGSLSTSSYLITRTSAPGEGSRRVQRVLRVGGVPAADRARVEADVCDISSISCPFVLRHEAIFFQGAHLCVLTEHAAGGSLRARIFHAAQGSREPLKLDQVLKTTAQLAVALEALHQRGLTHMDVSPEHIYLTADGDVRLGHFALGCESLIAEGSLSRVGTSEYLSPERVRGEAFGPSADMWALGCVLAEMITLNPAFPEFAGSLLDLGDRICRGAPAAHLPTATQCARADVHALLHALLRTNPNARPTASQVLAVPCLRDHAARARAQQATFPSSPVLRAHAVLDPAASPPPFDKPRRRVAWEDDSTPVDGSLEAITTPEVASPRKSASEIARQKRLQQSVARDTGVAGGADSDCRRGVVEAFPGLLDTLDLGRTHKFGPKGLSGLFAMQAARGADPPPAHGHRHPSTSVVAARGHEPQNEMSTGHGLESHERR